MQLTKSRVILPRFYRNFALIFFIVGLILIFVLGYYTLGRAEIMITTTNQDVEIETVVDVKELPLEAQLEDENSVAGKILSLELEDVKTYPTSGSREEETDVVGQVTIVNNYSKNQPLVATTRLLTPDGVLLRIKEDVNIPAGGQVTVWVYPDKPEEFTEVKPTKFTIPGLWAGLQDKIYAGNNETLKKGAKKIKTVIEQDIENAEKDFTEILTRKASEEVGSSLSGDQAFYSKLVQKEIISSEPSAKVGDSVDEFTLKMKIRAIVIAFDEIKLLNLVREKMAASLSQDKELVDFDTENIEYGVESYDLENKVANIKVKTGGKSVIKGEGGILDKSQLGGMSKQEVMDYMAQFPEVQDVEVVIQPSWIFKIPKNPDRIDIIIR